MKETIVALATPPGLSAIAAVRVSGAEVAKVCKTVLSGFKMQPRTACLAKAFSKATQRSNPETLIDRLIAIYYPAPNSYTGEDFLELYPHGNPFIVRKLMEAICAVPGVRLARRGEFTERAFLNGKIDLSQAEALGDVLNASDSKSLSNAQRHLNGELSKEIKELAKSIKMASAHLEMEMDFAEEVVSENSPPPRYLEVEVIQYELRNLKKRFKILQKEPRRAVLFGAPNAGKSSLINALVRKKRLLVSEAPGTTRDFVEVPLHLPNGDILLVDTAGLAGEAQNKIDELAMQKSKEVLEKANAKILVIDASIPFPSEFEEWARIADIIVYTHSDISPKLEIPAPKNDSQLTFKVDSTRSIGTDELLPALNNFFFTKEEESEVAWITSERQIACINKAEEYVDRVFELLAQGSLELAAFEMREARNALFSITGEISDDSVLDLIFSSYCIGK